MKFTTSQVGCYADGAHGPYHVRARLADLLADYAPDDALEAELRADTSDDASEETEALERLNELCHGCYFDLVDGDLMLVAKELD